MAAEPLADGIFEPEGVGELGFGVVGAVVGDVGGGADQTPGVAGVVVDDVPFGLDPADFAIGKEEAVIDLELASGAFAETAEGLAHGGEVRGINEGQPKGAAGGLYALEADGGGPGAGEVAKVGAEVPIKNTIAAGLGGEFVAVCGGAEAAGGETLLEVALDAREGDGEIDGLGDVVIGAGVQAGDDLLAVGQGGDHDDGEFRGVVGGAEEAQEVQTGHAGHHLVEEDEVVFGALDGLEGFRAVGSDIDGVAGALQAAGEHVAVGLFVVDDEKARRGGKGAVGIG